MCTYSAERCKYLTGVFKAVIISQLHLSVKINMLLLHIKLFLHCVIHKTAFCIHWMIVVLELLYQDTIKL